MTGFTAHRLEFTLEAVDPVMFPMAVGTALRGAIFAALWDGFCAHKAAPTCAVCPLVMTCPVALLVATMAPADGVRPTLLQDDGEGISTVDAAGGLEGWAAPSGQAAPVRPDDGDERQGAKQSLAPAEPASAVSRYLRARPTGDQLRRPYTIEPPLPASRRYAPGERITFGLTIFASAWSLLPYVVLAVHQWQQRGIGQRQRSRQGQRGRARLIQVLARHPLTGATGIVWQEGADAISLVDLPVTSAQVTTQARAWPLHPGTLTLHFRTPTRLVANGRLVRGPDPQVLLARLLERLNALSRALTGSLPLADPRPLLAQAATVRVEADRTSWAEGWSPSGRLRRSTPIGGFIGRAEWQADPATLGALLPWLLWGSIIHVGKDTVKGNGWYDVVSPQ